MTLGFGMGLGLKSRGGSNLVGDITDNNFLSDPFDLEGAAWSNVGAFTFSAASSYFSGKSAQDTLNPNTVTSRRIEQVNAGTFSGGNEQLSWWLENDDASVSEIRVFDTANLARIRLNWGSPSTLTDLSSTNLISSSVTVLAASGPNGGELVRVDIVVDTSGSSGNGRDVRLFATGTGQNADSIIHHAIQMKAA